MVYTLYIVYTIYMVYTPYMVPYTYNVLLKTLYLCRFVSYSHIREMRQKNNGFGYRFGFSIFWVFGFWERVWEFRIK
jgi:hypothetical protein